MGETVEIIRAGDGSVVTAELVARCAAADFNAAEAEWGPLRSAAWAFTLASEHGHWNWGRKASPLSNPAYRGIGIRHDGRMQGLALLIVAGKVSRFAPIKPLVYVDFIEVAPWNSRTFSDPILFSGVGTELVKVAIRLSVESGFAGRIGLHSLPQAEGFYDRRCLMAGFGADPNYDDLKYFEFSAEAAEAFLRSSPDVER